ncbi:tubulin binding cofactor C-domain-containing protein [Spinellus fusiger]|nr:tubulin binding cofactor C-domain-containing protein [Spinellus fusiger]
MFQYEYIFIKTETGLLNHLFAYLFYIYTLSLRHSPVSDWPDHRIMHRKDITTNSNSVMSDLASNSTDASLHFWNEFKLERQEIEKQMEQSRSLTTTQLPNHFNTLLQRINTLEKNLTKATAFIPPYDERQYTLQIKALSQALEVDRAKLIPKPKFSFKSRKAKTENPVIRVQAVPVPAMAVSSFTKTEDEDMLRFSDISHQWLTLKDLSPSDRKSRDVSLSNLHRCVVSLLDDTLCVSAVHIKNVTECIILCGTVEGSVLLYGFSKSIMVIDCHQFRMHDAENVDILLCVSSHPIIEDSQNVRVGPFKKQEKVLNYFNQMEDFNWLKKTASPNWRVMEEEEISRYDAITCLTPSVIESTPPVPEDRLTKLLEYLPKDV